MTNYSRWRKRDASDKSGHPFYYRKKSIMVEGELPEQPSSMYKEQELATIDDTSPISFSSNSRFRPSSWSPGARYEKTMIQREFLTSTGGKAAYVAEKGRRSNNFVVAWDADARD